MELKQIQRSHIDQSIAIDRFCPYIHPPVHYKVQKKLLLKQQSLCSKTKSLTSSSLDVEIVKKAIGYKQSQAQVIGYKKIINWIKLDKSGRTYRWIILLSFFRRKSYTRIHLTQMNHHCKAVLFGFFLIIIITFDFHIDLAFGKNRISPILAGINPVIIQK